jgi:hypothetical protein
LLLSLRYGGSYADLDCLSFASVQLKALGWAESESYAESVGSLGVGFRNLDLLLSLRYGGSYADPDCLSFASFQYQSLNDYIKSI